MSRKEKKFHFIYKTIDTRNNNFYVGMHSTDNLNDGYIGSGTRLKHLIHKHGKDIFTLEILEFLPNRNSLKIREQEIITQDFLLVEKCMNLQPGGSGGFKNEEHQLKCSQAAGIKHRERMLNDSEYRKKMTKMVSESNKKRLKKGTLKPIQESYSWVGKKHKPETIDKMKSSKQGQGIGINNSQFGTCWVTNETENKKIKKTELELYLNDGWRKGVKTKIKGESVKTSKLTNSDVIKIKQLISEGDLSSIKISNQFNVAPQTIDKIKKGLTWTHIIIKTI